MVNEEKLRASIDACGHPQDLLYFFERLKNPKVFDALKRWHMFDSPPNSRRDDGRIVFVPWPQGKYLANVANSIPDEVANVIRDISTDNVLVVYDLVAAVKNMPTSVGKTLVKPLKAWFEADPDRLHYVYLDLAARFADAGELVVARKIARCVLALVPVDDRFESLGLNRRRAEAKIGDVHYGMALDAIERSIGDAQPLEFVTMLAYRLQDALEIEGECASDYSTSWLPEIRDDVSRAHGVKQHLALKIYSASCKAINAGTVSVDEILSVLDRFDENVFARISVAVVTAVGSSENAKALLARRRTLLLYRQGTTERSEFLARFFPEFDQPERQHIVARLRAGVMTKARVAALVRERIEQKNVEAAVEGYRARQMYAQLKPIGQHLRGADLSEFDDLSERFAHDDDDVPKHGETRLGPTAPKSLEELRELSTAAILSYLEAWTPTADWFAPSREGLGRTLQPLIAERRSEFLEQWQQVSKLPPIYIRHVVEAIRPHAAGADFNYDGYVSLMEICKADGLEHAGKYAGFDNDEDSDAADEENSWSALRQIVAFALTDIMRSKSMPRALRSRVFGIIESITADPDPTPDQDDRYIGDTLHGQPWNLALNSARGAGMLALFEYARWVNSLLKTDADDFDLYTHAAELFSLLDRMLERSVERTRAVRSTYGQNFVSIYAVSRTWTKAAVERIFTEDDAGGAAWEAYLIYNRIFGETFAVLRPWYERHVARIGEEPDADRTDWYPAGSLGAHLLAPYLWGRLDLNDGPFAVFVRDAPPSAMSHMLTSAGNALHSPNWPEDAMRRFHSLYERVLELYRDRPLEERRKVLGVFGLWFISEHVNPQWALSTLADTLRATSGTISMEWRALERLGALSAVHPLQTVRALDLLVKTQTPFPFMNEDGVRQTLQNANSAGGDSANTAVRINDELMKMGVRQYADIFG